MATKAALTMKEQKFVAWDFALAKDGWQIVEANCRGQLAAHQICEKKGARAELKRIFGEEF